MEPLSGMIRFNSQRLTRCSHQNQFSTLVRSALVFGAWKIFHYDDYHRRSLQALKCLMAQHKVSAISDGDHISCSSDRQSAAEPRLRSWSADASGRASRRMSGMRACPHNSSCRGWRSSRRCVTPRPNDILIIHSV